MVKTYMVVKLKTRRVKKNKKKEQRNYGEEKKIDKTKLPVSYGRDDKL